MSFNPNASQKKALDAKGNTLVTASAGSGKTAVLTNRICNLLKDARNNKEDININNFLVLTFTNAAAYSMKRKIKNLITGIIKEEKDDKEKLYWKKQLTLLDDADISTFHGFALKIIKNNAYKLGIRSDIDMIDDFDMAVILNDEIAKILKLFYEESLLSFDDFKNKYPDASKEQLKELKNAYEQIVKADDAINTVLTTSSMKSFKDFSKSIKKMYYYIKANGNTKETAEKLVNNYTSGNNLPDDLFEKITLFNSMYEDMIRDRIDATIEILEKYKQDTNLDKAIVDFLDDNINRIKDAKTNPEARWSFATASKKLKEADPNFDLFKDDTKKYKKLKENLKAFDDEKIIGITVDDIMSHEEEILYGDKKLTYDLKPVIILFNIASYVYDNVTYVKKTRNVLDFDDMEKYLHKLLCEEECDEQLLKELKNKYKYILVDEYQDTSNIQEDIINVLENNNVFQVGDVKQSIYSFRNARPDLFINKMRRYNDDNKLGQVIELNENYRSSKEIIEVVNFFFKKLMYKESCGYDYGELKAFRPEEKKKVEYIFCDKDANENDAKTPFETKDDEEENETNSLEDFDTFKKYTYIMAKRIRELHDKEEYKYSDIAILARPMNKYKSAMCEIFDEFNIPYQINREGYLDSPEVERLISFLRILDFRYDSVHFASVLVMPYFNFTVKDIYTLTRYKGSNLIANMYGFIKHIIGLDNTKDTDKNDKEFKVFLTKFFKEKIEDSDFIELTDEEKMLKDKVFKFLYFYYDYQKDLCDLRPSQLIKKFVNETKYELNVGLNDNESIRNIYDFINLLERIEGTAKVSVKSVLGIIDDIKNDKIKLNDEGNSTETTGDDCVIIETIHKSKGLEYKVVFLTLLDNGFNYADTKGNIVINERYGIGLNPIMYDELLKRSDYSIIKDALVTAMKYDVLLEESRILYVGMTRPQEKLIIINSASVNGLSDQKYFNKNIGLDMIGPKSKINSLGKLLALVFPSNEKEKQEFFDDNKDLEEYLDVTTLSPSELEDKVKEIKEANDQIKVDRKVPKEKILKLLGDEDKEETLNVFNIPYSMSVSAIKKDMNSKKAFVFNKKIKDMTNDEITGTEKGTLYHKLAKYIEADTSIEKCFKELKERNVISEEEYDLAINDIDTFTKYQSSTFVQDGLKNAKEIHREYPFIMKMKVKDIWKDNEDISDEDKEREVIIEGIVDCLWENKDGSITIIDYKTDKKRGEEKASVSHIKSMYTIQLDLYKDAIEKALGKKVKDTYLYLFNAKEMNEVQIR